MQVIHVRFPPSAGPKLTPTRREKVFTHGCFFCFVNKPETIDELFLSAPDSRRIATLREGISGAEAVELIPAPSAASKWPNGSGNKPAVQRDLPPTEAAVLTNSGVLIINRRRFIEVFDAAIR